jgi:hypothetical protein
VLLLRDQSAQRRGLLITAGAQSVQKPRDRNIGSRSAMLRVCTCSLRTVETFSDGEERNGFVLLSSRINMQYSRVLDSLHENTFKKTIIIQ